MNKLSLAGTCVSATVLACAPAFAADVNTVPRFDVRIEQNDNFDLTPGGGSDSDVYGYIADAGVLFDIATPRGETAIRPRVRLQEFPDREDLERVEAFLDVNSRYRWERSNLSLDAEASRRDVYNTETLSGEFDPLDPDGGVDPDTGEVVIGETRTLFALRPTFEHRITERTSLGVGAQFQTAVYDADEGGPTRTDYDFGLLGAYLGWAVNELSTVTVGAYASRYEADDDSLETDAVGGQLGYSYRWSATDGIDATVFYEKNDTTDFDPVRTEESTNEIGGNLSAWRRYETSTWRLTLGRRFIPTGEGGKSEVDQLRFQYDRDLTQRLSLRGIVRLESQSALSTTRIGINRDYGRADLSLKWFATPTWYIGGGYARIWLDREAAPEDADNNKFYVNFGYQGRSRR